MVERLNNVNEPEERNSEKIKTDPELIEDLRIRHPEWFAGTPEWSLRVKLEMAQKMYDETGLIMML